jgi:hypothetical protein
VHGSGIRHPAWISEKKESVQFGLSSDSKKSIFSTASMNLDYLCDALKVSVVLHDLTGYF